jgi:hypothetical protein
MNERLSELQRRFGAQLEDADEGPLSISEMQQLCCLQADEILRLRISLSTCKRIAEGEWHMIPIDRCDAIRIHVDNALESGER